MKFPTKTPRIEDPGNNASIKKSEENGSTKHPQGTESLAATAVTQRIRLKRSQPPPHTHIRKYPDSENVFTSMLVEDELCRKYSVL